MAAVSYVLGALAGYLVGGINPSYLIGKIKGFDIRRRGSGNAGASNVAISIGVAAGIACALFDIFKAFFAVFLTEHVIFPHLPEAAGLRGNWLAATVGSSCILGHVFPPLMGFRGGKGLACLGGMILAFDWRVFLIMLGVAVVLVAACKYICIVPICAAVAFPILYGVLRADPVGALIYAVASVVILCKHLVNIRRICKGTELKISSMWKREEAIDTLKEHLKENTGEVPEEDGGEVPDYLTK